MNRLLVLDQYISDDLIRERQRLGNDRYDEVWDGVYVMPPMPNNFHQDLVGDMYAIPNWRIVNHRVPGLKGYLKGGNLRSPLDVAISFGAEQVMDDLAHMAGIDAYQFRRQNINDDRWLAVLDAVAKAANWTPRKAAENLSSARVVTGRGIGLGTHLSSYGAAVAEIDGLLS